ncbi:hypothetical protein Ddc_13503 [Ditylenchus destructor]|nr:hypothetical protein Ddc_13503 [Ditylenchus destructor]
MKTESPLPSWVGLLPAFPGTLDQAAGLPLPSPNPAQTQEDVSRRLSTVTRSAVRQELMIQCQGPHTKVGRRVQPMPKDGPRLPLRALNTNSSKDKGVPSLRSIEAIYRPLNDKEAQYLVKYDKEDSSRWVGRSEVKDNHPREWRKFHKRALPNGSHPDEMFGIKRIINHRGCNCNNGCVCPSKQYEVLWEDDSRSWEAAAGIKTSYDYEVSAQEDSEDFEEWPVSNYEKNRRMNFARRN